MRIVYLMTIILLSVACMPMKDSAYTIGVTSNSVDEGLFSIPEKTTINTNDSVWYGSIHQTVSGVFLYAYQVHSSSINAYRYYLSDIPANTGSLPRQWVVVKGKMRTKENVQVKELAPWKNINEEYPRALKRCNRFIRSQLQTIDKQASVFLTDKLQATFLSVPYFETDKLIFVDKTSNIMGIKCGEKRISTKGDSLQFLSYIALYNFAENEIIKVNIVHYDN